MEPNQYTGTYGFMLMADRTVRKVPHARIKINTPYYVGNVEAVCLTDALYDLLIVTLRVPESQATLIQCGT